ncbi:ACP S-malonyltransferase [Allonocardiopsis opalescens]|uniref:Malonyl CoA-acyl carrier protein transacylase n=1 Tax=Allonocardiopsis opalescens TaxID=1144618 RepID=A0A2T0QCJ2_9ACTN|nr:ACP S-malonyltransferase [Allonocardiopsis opalescens]PRY01625.1 [acyl-carrier-protein] S-malonyltransferase [Allonocardiopsis opalescens]
MADERAGLADSVVVFPGQGSQAPGMGRPWRGHPAWAIVDRAERVLGRPLAPYLLDPAETPANTADIQLTVFLTGMMAWTALTERLGQPKLLAGHSLGQLTALTAAGVIAPDDAIRLIALRGALTDDACRRVAGGMLAVLGLDAAAVDECCALASGRCWVANDNAPGQQVLAGTPAGLAAAGRAAVERGARKLVPLAVPGAFHSPLMATAARAFAEGLRGITFHPPRRPLVSNADAALVTGTHPWRAELAAHLVRPVRWRESQLRFTELGARSLVEVGHGTTLAGIARRTVPELRPRGVDGPMAVDVLATLLSRAAEAPPAALAVR